MNYDPHKIRCFVCDLKKIWHNLNHRKVARWTVIVHIIYYGHAAFDAQGGHLVTAILCAAALLLELVAPDD